MNLTKLEREQIEAAVGDLDWAFVERLIERKAADVRRAVAESCMGIAFEEGAGTDVGRRIGQRIAREVGGRP